MRETEIISKRSNLYIYGGTSVTSLRAYEICRALSRRHGRLDLVLADHLRLFADSGDNENSRLGEISWMLKRIAKDIPTRALIAAQLNRAVEGQQDKRPDLKDLRESGHIEENADTVTALYRERYYDDGADETAEFIARKNRNGERNRAAKGVFVAGPMHFGDLAYGLD